MSLSAIARNRAWTAAWQVFSRAFVILGLPLLAWGLDDYAGFFSDPARAGYAALALAQALALGCLVYLTPPQPPPERHYELPDWHMQIYEVILILAAYGARREILTWPASPVLSWVGLAFAMLAIFLSVWANLTWTRHLRRAGANPLPDPAFLTGGPFRWIRYPGPLYLILLTTGFVIIARSWIGLVLLAPLLAIFAHRIHYWDRMNGERYGRPWFLRCRTSWRIVPYVY